MKWKTERKWDRSKVEEGFEKMLTEEGGEILGVKEFVSSTSYLIRKNGLEIEFSVYAVSKSAADEIKRFNAYFKILEEHEQLKRQLEGREGA